MIGECGVLCVAALATVFGSVAGAGSFVRDVERDSLSLAGRWEVLLEHEQAKVWDAAAAESLKPWRPVDVPGRLQPGVPHEDRDTVGNVWAVRTVELTADQAARDVVLNWGQIRHGATVWVNGQQVGHHPTIGPYACRVPKGVLKEGGNRLVLKIPGWAGIAKGEQGKPLIPTGSGTQSWGNKVAGIYDDIWLDFYDGVYVKWALAMPDVRRSAVTLRVWFDGPTPRPESVELGATVRDWPGGAQAGTAALTVAPGDGPVEITVPVKNARLWTPGTPNLYVAEVAVRADGRSCDALRFRFGMRQFEVVDGHFRLNGKPIWLRGSNLVCEWQWGTDWAKDPKGYLVDEARVMNLTCFRTHTLPPSTAWTNVSDEQGVMILAEMPVLYNNRDFKFAPSEWEVFHRNALLDSTGWVTKLWNHPSVVIWVLSNESPNDIAWESGPYWRHVHDLDPTRLAMRAGDFPSNLAGTPDIADMHTCGNYTWGGEGRVIDVYAKAAAEKDKARPLMNSEYMNRLGTREEINVHWLGRADHPEADLNYGEFAMEHTEAMRRLNFDGILPYMYAWWVRVRGNTWREDFPHPVAAALHSAMSPVLASLDMYDRNVVVGSPMRTRLCLINETDAKVKAKVELYLTPEDPQMVPIEGALGKAIWRGGVDAVFEPCAIGETTIEWTVPASPGRYYLAAVTRLPGAKPVVSQRVVRAIPDPAAWTDQVKGRRVVLLGGDDRIRSWLTARGASCSPEVPTGAVDADVVLVCDAHALSAAQRSAATKPLLDFVSSGGRLVVLSHVDWPWRELVDFTSTKDYSSRAFAYPGVEHWLLDGVGERWLWRWNGPPNRVADRGIGGEVLKQGQKVLWIQSPDYPVVHSVRRGDGEILVCFLALGPRLMRGGASYDPVAEIVMANVVK